MQTRYLVRMLGIAVIHIIAFVTFMTIAGQFEGLIIALPMNLTVLVVINLAGAWYIFRPVQRYLLGEVDLSRRRAAHQPIGADLGRLGGAPCRRLAGVRLFCFGRHLPGL